jgi:hypothetical protein
MSSKLNSVVLVVSLAFAAGCSGPPTDYEGDLPTVGASVAEQLKSRQEFALMPASEDGTGSVLVVDVAGQGEKPQQRVLPVLAGHVLARVNEQGMLHLEALAVDLPDLDIAPESFPPRGLHLRGLHLALVSDVVAQTAWTDDGDAVTVVGAFDLSFDWGILLGDGAVHPLATQRLRELPFQIDIMRVGAGGLAVHVAAIQEGQVWRWGEFVELSNLIVDLTGLN